MDSITGSESQEDAAEICQVPSSDGCSEKTPWRHQQGLGIAGLPHAPAPERQQRHCSFQSLTTQGNSSAYRAPREVGPEQRRVGQAQKGRWVFQKGDGVSARVEGEPAGARGPDLTGRTASPRNRT